MIRKIPVTLTKSEMDRILDIPNERTKSGLRNKTILSLMWDSGARVSDITNLKPGNINIKKREILIKDGKCNVDRHLTFSDLTGKLLLRYLNQRPKGQYFFCSEYPCNNPDPKKKKKSIGNKLNRGYIFGLIRNLAKRAKIDKKIGCHSIRHSFALDYYKRTHDLVTLQKILGHESLQSTQIYVYMNSADITAASEAYFKKRDGLDEDKNIAEKIKEIEKELDRIEEMKKELELLKTRV